MLAAITPLLVGLGAVAAFLLGVFGGLWLVRPPLSEKERARLQDEAATRAAQKAVREVITRLR